MKKMDSPEINGQNSEEDFAAATDVTPSTTARNSNNQSDESSRLSPLIIFCNKVTEKNGDVKTTYHRVETLYLCEKTRPRWLSQLDQVEDKSPLDEEFPILPLSKESMDLYKKFRARRKLNLTKEEKKILFGSDASDSSDEEKFTFLCDTCKPKILSKSVEPKPKGTTLFKKLRSIQLLKDSRLKTQKKSIQDEEDENEVEKCEESVEMTKPRDVLRDIMDEAVNKLENDMKEMFKKFDMSATTPQQEEPTAETKQPIRDDWDGDFDDEESDVNLSESTSSASFVVCSDKGSEENDKPAESSTSCKSSDELVQKMYLKPEIPTRKYGKARYTIESDTREVNLLEKLDSNDLKELKSYFFSKNIDYNKIIMDYDVRNDAKYAGIPFKKRNFMEAIDNIIGSVKEYTLAAGKLFEALEVNKILKEGVLSWEQFLDLIIASGKSAEPEFRFVLEENKTDFHPFSKSPIINIIKMQCNKKLIYTALSRLGKVAVLDEHLNIQHTYNVKFNQYKSKKCCWLTDACYSSQSETLFVVASTRCLYLYNTSRVTHKLTFTISSIWEIPECVYYSPYKKNEALILTGDNKGNITTYHFKQINKSFFKLAPDKEGEQHYFWDDLKEQTDWVTVTTDKNVHNDIILQLEYIPKNNCVISCSLDRKASVAIRFREPNRKPYIFKVEKGIKCFRLNKHLGIMATLSGDNVARLWDPMNTKRPVGQLKGHRAPILDIILITNNKTAVTYAQNKELKVWDMETFICQQTLAVSFKEVPYSMHLLLNSRILYLHLQEDVNTKSASQSSSKSTNAENVSNLQSTSHLLIVNINNIKMLAINDTSGMAEEIIVEQDHSEENPSEKTDRTDINFEEELIDFTASISCDEDLEDQTYFKSNKFLSDLVKEGTPHLALNLHHPASLV